MNKRKRRKRKSRIILFVIFLIICAALYFVLFKTIEEKSSTKVIDKIDKYGYTLEKRDTELMQTTFGELKEILSKKSVDEEKYAKKLSELFVIDLYTINNKKNRYDVGADEYVYKDYKEQYKLTVEDTLYNTVGSISKSKYPEVSSVEVKDINESTFIYNDIKFDSYIVTLSWDYVKDLEYDNEGTIELIKSEDKLYVASFEPTIKEAE